ncbi:MAG: adenylate cyclase [Verrucomicrobiota bacterium]
MATGTNTGQGALSKEHLTELLELMKDADSVELKVTLPESEHRSAVDALGLDPLDAEIRQVYFFDTRDLRLQQGGLAVRARRVQGRRGDTVVKLRPVVPHDLPEDLRRSAGMSVEVDAMPGSYVCSASMKGKVPNEQVRDAIRGERAVRKLFSKEQRSFFADHAPEGLALDDLAILGPTFVLKLVLRPEALGRRLVAEVWLLPDGSRILELSTKSMPGEAFQAAVEVRAFLEGLGLDLTADSHTKTKTTLEYFAGHLGDATA